MSRRSAGSHENYIDHGVQKTSSDKSFGIVFAVVFALIAAFQFKVDRPLAAGTLAAVASVFLVLACLRPQTLAPLNRLWGKLGLALHKITNPLLMGAIFFLVCTPMGVGMRMFGFDPLKKKVDSRAESYWVIRDPVGPPPESMKNQF